MTDQRVLIIGGGIGGLTTALALARREIRVDLVEQAAGVGGHAARLACKATERCVKCGACLADQTIAAAVAHPWIRLYTACRVAEIRRSDRYRYTLAQDPRQDRPARTLPGEADAVVLASGFQTFDPSGKPYGYGLYPDVITNLELEGMLREGGGLRRPSNGAAPGRMAFIQCVGSRDATLGHLWCSGYCCAAALRAARLLKHHRPALDITIFYIDIQTFGRDFELVYAKAREEIRFVRAIPADAFQGEGATLRLTWVETSVKGAVEEEFDLVVLSTGMTPRPQTAELATSLGMAPPAAGFLRSACLGAKGAFVVGAARGPMGIADTIADAGRVAWQIVRFLEGGR
ncbi:MAG: CoB--CoM heterodisulfide reductase iron-sulfur subunit A family protein [Desulfobacteraceae bacterium]|nr:MAG: CoB--CoM heterodisulfide reductase iron-sulfur subunit A family protein [Desulfobacteraceae bacterium]